MITWCEFDRLEELGANREHLMVYHWRCRRCRRDATGTVPPEEERCSGSYDVRLIER